jgi:hypothetical protein
MTTRTSSALPSSSVTPGRRLWLAVVLAFAVVVGGLVPTAPAAALASAVLTSKAAPATVAYGKSVTVSGTATSGGRPLAGARVKIVQYTSGGGWALIGAVTSSSTGAYSYSFAPTWGRTVRAELARTTIHAAAASPSTALFVQPQIYGSTVSGDGSSAPGTTRQFTGSVHGGLVGKRIKVERFEPSGWVLAGQAYVQTGGSFSIPVATTRFGNQGFRVVMPSQSGLITKQLAPVDVGSYGGTVKRYADARACFGAAALPGPCDNSSLPVTPSISGGAYERDRTGAFECYSADVTQRVPKCSYGSTRGDALRVALTGDSHAAMLKTGLLPRLTDLNWRVDTYIGRGCVLSAPIRGDTCETRSTGLASSLGSGAYDLVLVTAVRAENKAAPAADPKIAGYTAAWKKIAAKGTTVAAIADNPTLPQAVLDCVDRSTTYTQASKCQTSRATAFALSDPLGAAVKAVPGAALVDVSNRQCTKTACAALIGHVMAYRDAHHLTTTYEKTLAPYIIERLAPAL